MALDLEELLAPVSEEAPAGPDLAYDVERAEIEQAFETSVSVDTTGAEGAVVDVEWRRVIELIAAQAAKTKDIWLAVYLCRAAARSGRLDLLETGAGFLAGLLDRYWDTVHPQLEEYGFQGRKGPCDSLTRIGEFLGPLRRVPLLQHPRFGSFSGADFERFHTGAEAEDGYALFRTALQDTPDEDLHAVAARLDAIAAALRNVDAVLMARADGDTGTNFKPTYDLLALLKQSVLAFSTVQTEPEIEPAAAGEAEPRPASNAPMVAGRVESREDVIRALDAVADYYRRKEPASPVPLVLRRARDWVNLDFLAVLEDIAPGGLDDAKRVLMSQRSNSGTS